ncbi:glycosyltransferase family 92 protein [Frigoriglobus tundricola]|uniref:Glycosyl transferase family 2 n=1 Tax=Frigoriglobus tundricola TaxID=2774151 RepID=A0A6M5Z7V4_9BACT|nr:glycosyltransferase family 92 protein [Frigoriglobus tundricola]QJX01323.1 hypothetical protein FTUN_8967 [Frigoriglobus tundricola]
MHYLSVCAIVRNEARYLPEWVEFHRLVGVEHFYVYDDDSEVPVAVSLAAQIAAGYVTVEAVPGRGQHMQVYNRHGEQRRYDSMWTAFIDGDEFLVPHEGDDLRPLLSEFESEYAGLVVNWQVFGTSGHLLRPTGLLTEVMTHKLPVHAEINRHVKSIIQTTKLRHFPHPHRPVMHDGCHLCNEHRTYAPGPWLDVSVDRVQINHYYAKSLLDWGDKMRRGYADGSPPQHLWGVYDVDAACAEHDACAVRFADRLRARLC